MKKSGTGMYSSHCGNSSVSGNYMCTFEKADDEACMRWLLS